MHLAVNRDLLLLQCKSIVLKRPKHDSIIKVLNLCLEHDDFIWKTKPIWQRRLILFGTCRIIFHFLMETVFVMS